jgi:hypothetical protein
MKKRFFVGVVGVVVVAAFLLVVPTPASASAPQCNVLRKPSGVPGQNPITLCTNVSSLPAGEIECRLDDDAIAFVCSLVIFVRPFRKTTPTHASNLLNSLLKQEEERSK